MGRRRGELNNEQFHKVTSKGFCVAVFYCFTKVLIRSTAKILSGHRPPAVNQRAQSYRPVVARSKQYMGEV